MTLLLDTQTIVWWLEDDDRLSKRAGDAISQAGDDAAVSAARVWELSIKRAAGRYAGDDLLGPARAAGFALLSMTGGPRQARGGAARLVLLKAPAKQSVEQLALLHEVQDANKSLYRGFLLKEELRVLYHLEDPTLAPAHLDAWLAWASRSKLEPFVKLARTIRAHRDGILAAIRLGLTNGRLEGLNSRIRLISHRSFGFHSPAPLIALAYLCCAGITIELPR